MIRIEGMIPLVVLQTGDTIEMIVDKHAYIVAGNGFFAKTEQTKYDGISKTEKLPGLLELAPKVIPKITQKIPFSLIDVVLQFFKQAYAKYYGEAVVIIYNNETDRNIWCVDVPKQEVSGGGAHYGENGAIKKIEGFECMGTIHSHGSMGAFHSGVDDKDEKDFDGIHITLGNVNIDKGESVSCRYMCGGVAFPMDFKDIVTEEVDFPLVEPPKEWMDQVSDRKYPTTTTWPAYRSQWNEDDYEGYGSRYSGYQGGCGFGRRNYDDMIYVSKKEIKKLVDKEVARQVQERINKLKKKFKFIKAIRKKAERMEPATDNDLRLAGILMEVDNVNGGIIY